MLIKEVMRINNQLVIVEATEHGITVSTETKCYALKNNKLKGLETKPSAANILALQRMSKDERLRDHSLQLSKPISSINIAVIKES